jgi:spoIIIJ-associated protein
MNERTTLEIIAPTVEEALAQGLAQLGLPATAVSVEVLDSGNKGLFGLGGRQVRVRLTVNPPGGVVERTPAPAAELPKPGVSERKQTPTRARDRGTESKPPRKESRPPRSREHAPEGSVQRDVHTTPRPPQAAAPRAAEMLPDGHDPILDKTEATISKLLYHMGLEAQVSAHYGEMHDDKQPIMVDVRGSDLGVLIGRRGETLDSFQYIAALMVGKETGQFVRLVVDVEGHRDRRERQLRQLAQRMAEQVLKTGRKLTLEPMRASERRIIHLELRDHPAVMTESVGEEPHRKVTIIPKE